MFNKVTLTILTLYKVGEKIHTLKSECPAEYCGVGIFLAAMEEFVFSEAGVQWMFFIPDELHAARIKLNSGILCVMIN